MLKYEKYLPAIFIGGVSLLLTGGAVYAHKEHISQQTRIITYSATVSDLSVRIDATSASDSAALERCRKVISDILGISGDKITCVPVAERP